jgi:hypothetical protein
MVSGYICLESPEQESPNSFVQEMPAVCHPSHARAACGNRVYSPKKSYGSEVVFNAGEKMFLFSLSFVGEAQGE